MQMNALRQNSPQKFKHYSPAAQIQTPTESAATIGISLANLQTAKSRAFYHPPHPPRSLSVQRDAGVVRLIFAISRWKFADQHVSAARTENQRLCGETRAVCDARRRRFRPGETLQHRAYFSCMRHCDFFSCIFYQQFEMAGPGW